MFGVECLLLLVFAMENIAQVVLSLFSTYSSKVLSVHFIILCGKHLQFKHIYTSFVEFVDFTYITIVNLHNRTLNDVGIHVTLSFGNCFWKLEKLHTTLSNENSSVDVAKCTLSSGDNTDIESIFISFVFSVTLCVCVWCTSYPCLLHSHFSCSMLLFLSLFISLLLALLNQNVNTEHVQVERKLLTKWT